MNDNSQFEIVFKNSDQNKLMVSCGQLDGNLDFGIRHNSKEVGFVLSLSEVRLLSGILVNHIKNLDNERI